MDQETPQTSQQTPPQSPPPQPIQSSSSHGKLIVAFILGGLLFASVAGAFYFFSQSGKTPPPTTNNTSNSPQPTPIPSKSLKNTAWKAPTKYVAYNANSDLVMGELNKKGETTLVKRKYKLLGTPNDVTVSPNGKYVTYLMLPEKTLQEFEKTPPYEFHGSSEWELHLIDITDSTTPIDSVIATEVYSGMGEEGKPVFWDANGTTLYYKKYVEQEPYSEYYSYNVSLKSSTKANPPSTIQTEYAYAPDGKQYVKFVLRKDNDPQKTVLEQRYDLVVVDVATSKEKVVYKDFETSYEKSVIFPDNNTIFLAREQFTDNQGNSVCYIEKIAVDTSIVTTIEQKKCPPGQSFTSFSNLEISPDGTLLTALYKEDPFGPSTAPNQVTNLYMSYIFTYHLSTGVKSQLGAQKLWYDNYFWLSDNEIMGTVPGGRAYSENPQTYIINIKDGSAKKDPNLGDMSVIKVF